jgi:hypothetical protein
MTAAPFPTAQLPSLHRKKFTFPNEGEFLPRFFPLLLNMFFVFSDLFFHFSNMFFSTSANPLSFRNLAGAGEKPFEANIKLVFWIG